MAGKGPKAGKAADRDLSKEPLRPNARKKLRLARVSRGMTQKQIADVVSIDQSAISEWENGKRGTSAENILKVADYLEVSPGWLLDESIPADWPPAPPGGTGSDEGEDAGDRRIIEMILVMIRASGVAPLDVVRAIVSLIEPVAGSEDDGHGGWTAHLGSTIRQWTLPESDDENAHVFD